MNKIFCFVLAAVIAVVAADRCYPETCHGEMHTLCKHPFKPAAQCIKPEKSGLDPNEIQEILAVHNKFRALVASGRETRGINGPQPAGVIPDLVWDDELAKVAQAWANQCQFGHDKCRDVERFQVGQNVAIKMHSSGYKATLTELITMWYDEVKDFNRDFVPKFQWQSWPQIGHYTQLVWGETRVVGCGTIKYKTPEWYTYYLVCNYGPSGNWIDSPVYETS